MKKSPLPICTDFIITKEGIIREKLLTKITFLDEDESSSSYVLYNRKNTIPFSHE